MIKINTSHRVFAYFIFMVAAKSKKSIHSGDKASQLLLSNAFAAAANAIFITDSDGKIIWFNKAFAELTGYSPEEIVGRNPNFLKSDLHPQSFYRNLWQTILAGDVWKGQIIDRRKDGRLITVEQVITPLVGSDGKIRHFIALQHDVTTREREHIRLSFLAHHDSLTGLPNRILLLHLLNNAVSQAKRNQLKLAILFVDLDGFKAVNDTLGHKIGDRLLVAVSQRMVSAVRKTDIVARLGGDEFLIVQGDIAEKGASEALAFNLIRRISEPYVLEGNRVVLGASIGIAIYPDDAQDAEELMKLADMAMYRAKHESRGMWKCHGF